MRRSSRLGGSNKRVACAPATGRRNALTGASPPPAARPGTACCRWAGEVAPQEGQKVVWAGRQQLLGCEMPPADIPLIEPVLAAMVEAARQPAGQAVRD
jgi:hypothetical protein